MEIAKLISKFQNYSDKFLDLSIFLIVLSVLFLNVTHGDNGLRLFVLKYLKIVFIIGVVASQLKLSFCILYFYDTERDRKLKLFNIFLYSFNVIYGLKSICS